MNQNPLREPHAAELSEIRGQPPPAPLCPVGSAAPKGGPGAGRPRADQPSSAPPAGSRHDGLGRQLDDHRSNP